MTPRRQAQLRDEIADHLADMAQMFDSRCKLSLVMRSPHLPDGDLIVTDDDPALVIKAIERLSGYPLVGPGEKVDH